MKRFMIILIAVLMGNVVLAQQEIKDSFVKKGKLIEATIYHDNGMIAQKGFYNAAGKLHGQWISYDAQGNKTAIARYEDGAKTGTWFFWVGDELHEVTYTDSRLTRVSSWENTGVQVVSNND